MSSFKLKMLSAVVLFSATSVALAQPYAYPNDRYNTRHRMTTRHVVYRDTRPMRPVVDYKNEVEVIPERREMAPCAASILDGFYIGAQGGYDSYRVRETAGIAGLGATNFVLNSTGGVGGLFFGFGTSLDYNLYLGAEIFGNYSDAKSTSSITALGLPLFSTEFKAKKNWGVSLLPGIKLNDFSILYVRLGYNRAKLEVNENLGGIAYSKDHISHGFNYGLGIETALINNVSVRLEYSHTRYSSFTSTLGVNVRPSDNQFMAGVLFHF